jgi:hypothetical protein
MELEKVRKIFSCKNSKLQLNQQRCETEVYRFVPKHPPNSKAHDVEPRISGDKGKML